MTLSSPLTFNAQPRRTKADGRSSSSASTPATEPSWTWSFLLTRTVRFQGENCLFVLLQPKKLSGPFLIPGRRVAAFGYMAGFAGSFVGLDMWCQQQITYVAGYLPSTS